MTCARPCQPMGMFSGATARFCLAIVLSCVALFALLYLWFGVAYALNESGLPVQILLIAGTLVVMIFAVVRIFTLVWSRPTRHRRVDH